MVCVDRVSSTYTGLVFIERQFTGHASCIKLYFNSNVRAA